jgi:ribose/xylose/arabinose/galactoside ABC-type transport system permease subunit
VAGPPAAGPAHAQHGPPADPPITSTLVGSAVTLVLGAVVAVVMLGLADVPSGYFSNEFVRLLAAALAAAAAPVALLVAWDEIDLSSIGTVALGGYVYAEVTDDSVVPGLVLAALVGLAVGAAVGLFRWLSGAHSALVSLGAAALTTGLVFQLGPGPTGQPITGGRLEGAELAILTMLAVTGLAVGLAFLFRDTGTASPGSPAGAAGPRVVPAFALSGLAGSAFGAFMAGSQGFFGYGTNSTILVLVFTAVAVGGVVRGSGPVAPPVAALGAIVVVLIQDATRFNNWSVGSDQLALGGLFLVCLLVANVARRVLTPSRRGGQF